MSEAGVVSVCVENSYEFKIYGQKQSEVGRPVTVCKHILTCSVNDITCVTLTISNFQFS
jgi:hypothetical protein